MDHTIVVIEDEPALRQYAVETFSAAGLDVRAFDDAASALAHIRMQPSAVTAVFTDIKLINAADGLRIAGDIMRANPAITVVVTSERLSDCPTGLVDRRLRYIGTPWAAVDVLNAIIDAKQDD